MCRPMQEWPKANRVGNLTIRIAWPLKASEDHFWKFASTSPTTTCQEKAPHRWGENYPWKRKIWVVGGCRGCAFPPRNPRGPFVPQAAPLCSSQTRTHRLSFRVWTKALVDITECTYSQIPREFFSKSKYVCVLAFQLDFKQDLCFLHLRFFPIFSIFFPLSFSCLVYHHAFNERLLGEWEPALVWWKPSLIRN